jgi:hypothetical protein
MVLPASSGGRWASFLVSTARAIRARLLASATIFRLHQFESHSVMTTKLDRAVEQYYARKENREKARLMTDLLRASSSVPSHIDLWATYPGASEVLDAPFAHHHIHHNRERYSVRN